MLDRSSDGNVTTSALAERLGVTAASATAMIKRLASVGLVRHEPYHGVSLTEAGTQAALEVIRHHRLLELYLMQALGLSWDEVHAEAERLEHHLSEALEARIDAALGHPTHDPHGDPIPTAALELADEDDRPLSELEHGAAAVIRRVPDGDPGLLRYLAELGFVPGRARRHARHRALRRPADGRGGRRAPCHLARARRAHPHRRVRVNPPPPPARSDLPAVALPGEQKVLEAAQRSLAERRGGLRGLWPFLGPAFIAAIAYIDPGNFATNIAAGAKYGYLLLWVILASNLMAMLIQTMSAKLGIATGHNLAEVSASTLLEPDAHLPLAAGRGGRDGHRPGRVHRRGARIPPALRHPAPARGRAHGRRRVRDPGRGAARRAPPRGRHHGARRDHRGRLRLPDVPREPRRQRRPQGPLQAGLRRHGERAAGGRHPRRDGHAARHLPALVAHAAPRDRHATPTSAAASSASSRSTS